MTVDSTSSAKHPGAELSSAHHDDGGYATVGTSTLRLVCFAFSDLMASFTTLVLVLARFLHTWFGSIREGIGNGRDAIGIGRREF
ncbi:hypothetical protein CC78DRAFT_133645 [Lojkania enalia]|uniref:Uncharacterized protein n=1 Tax=Lojkania enalia TaxID=147567 RepID=A0A9P4NC55_9PLEO|nr:hypothetical protein CC78DRAFT_133645 [Didymosphaeria enalia]